MLIMMPTGIPLKVWSRDRVGEAWDILGQKFEFSLKVF
jgi:hypothetical protein